MLAFFYDKKTNLSQDKNNIVPDLSEDTLRYLELVFVGDLMCHTPQIEYAKLNDGKYDFSPPFEYIKEIISSADFAIGNLETVLGGKEIGFSGYPFFNSPDDYALALREAGFDILITANNHSYDKGESALKRTARFLDSIGISYIGTFLLPRDFDSIRIFNKNGISFSLSAFTYGLNYINALPEDKRYQVNFISKKNIEKRLRQAKLKNCDINIAYLHYGDEYKREPSRFQKEIAQFCAEIGYDIVIGSHPHVLQPLEIKNSDSSKTGQTFVAYSLGNFISNQRHRFTDGGGILKILVGKNLSKDSVFIKQIDFYPTWVFKGKINNKRQYLILRTAEYDFSKIYEFLSKEDNAALVQSYKDAIEIINKYQTIAKIIPYEVNARDISTRDTLTLK